MRELPPLLGKILLAVEFCVAHAQFFCFHNNQVLTSNDLHPLIISIDIETLKASILHIFLLIFHLYLYQMAWKLANHNIFTWWIYAEVNYSQSAIVSNCGQIAVKFSIHPMIKCDCYDVFSPIIARLFPPNTRATVHEWMFWSIR
jgi:hypothetical protein